MKIKICGITNPADAEMALTEGADLLGFIFCKSPRAVGVQAAREVLRELPDPSVGVAVFNNQPLDEVRSILAETGLTIAQLHGQEAPDFVSALGVRVIKSFTEFTPDALDNLRRYDCWAYLLDVPKGQAARTHIDPDFAVCAKKYGKVIASGKLTADNVYEVIRRVRPFGVDTASGTECAPGKKDKARVRAFIQNARLADRETQRIKVEVR
ncbi:MAG: phosphoribosylanthranilate isomerase [Planctomycetes bacterium]|nr:phosphoribosylanthranilate isomerase [Planctomycetota bacterium]